MYDYLPLLYQKIPKVETLILNRIMMVSLYHLQYIFRCRVLYRIPTRFIYSPRAKKNSAKKEAISGTTDSEITSYFFHLTSACNTVGEFFRCHP